MRYRVRWTKRMKPPAAALNFKEQHFSRVTIYRNYRYEKHDLLVETGRELACGGKRPVEKACEAAKAAR